jgi:hypothetical protein
VVNNYLFWKDFIEKNLEKLENSAQVYLEKIWKNFQLSSTDISILISPCSISITLYTQFEGAAIGVYQSDSVYVSILIYLILGSSHMTVLQSKQ